jgi:hypothetical protein
MKKVQQQLAVIPNHAWICIPSINHVEFVAKNKPQEADVIYKNREKKRVEAFLLTSYLLYRPGEEK